MSAAPQPDDPGGFHFLYRTDRGLIDRATWWRGTLPIVGVGVVATAIWFAVRPYTHDALHQPPAAALFAYLYLLAFAFASLILLICEYNLSAKRFSTRGLPRVLAGLLPGVLLLAGACDWYIPRSEGQVPEWTVWIAYAAVVAVVVWNIVELGLRRDRLSASAFIAP